MQNAAPSVHVVPLPDGWKELVESVWRYDRLAVSPGIVMAKAARHVEGIAVDGRRVEVGCLAHHGLERKLLNALIWEELRRRQWLVTDEEPRPRSNGRTLWLVPIVPIPPTVNTSVRTQLAAGLQQAVVRSVAAHPASAGSPNHFIVVPRVCSCFISADRKPLLGRRARDDCQPWPRSSRLAVGGKVIPSSDLSRHVRVVSYEQVSMRDRQWSSKAGVAARLANIVVPYPSSFIGADSARGRPAPWELEWRKPVRVFAAFGMISGILLNLTKSGGGRAESSQDGAALGLRRELLTACAASEVAALRRSACAGKGCRFALRALVMQQLEAARVSPNQRHRERSCLRSATDCPRVMSLVFWAPHDGGDGAGHLSQHHRPRTGPLFVDDRETSDVLAVYRLMLASTFCLHIGGDTPTRKSFIDAIVASCIPVVTRNDSVFVDSLPFADRIPYMELVVYVPMERFLPLRSSSAATTAPSSHGALPADVGVGEGGAQSIVAHLNDISDGEVRRKQALLRQYAPLLAFPHPRPQRRGGTRSGLLWPIGGVAEKSGAVIEESENAVGLMIERLFAQS